MWNHVEQSGKELKMIKDAKGGLAVFSPFFYF